jgi:hypothetical protein
VDKLIETDLLARKNAYWRFTATVDFAINALAPAVQYTCKESIRDALPQFGAVGQHFTSANRKSR